MAEQQISNKKQMPIMIIAIAVIVVLVVGIIIWKVSSGGSSEENANVNKYAAKARSVEDIKINDNDSTEVKIQKLQGKIELLNKEINEKQEEINKESEKVNKMYEDKVSIMNKYQTGATQ